MAILKEDFDRLLLETGDVLLLDESGPLIALRDQLVEYWPLNESSGPRAGIHAGLTLSVTTVSGVSIGSAGGKVYALAADFESANSHNLGRADQAALSTGNIDFTVAAWVRMESKGANRSIVAKSANVAGQLNMEFQIVYFTATDRFAFEVCSGNAGLNRTARLANSFGVPALATWYLVLGWHDATANTINIQINNGTVDSTAYTFGSYDSTSSFLIGDSAFTEFWDGLIGPVMFWKRVLSSEERTQLYNGGNGLTYLAFTGTGSTGARTLAAAAVRPRPFAPGMAR